MYATYNIHIITNNLEFLQVFPSRQEAVDHLRKDAETHLSRFRGMARWITNKKELMNSPDGYYLKISQKHVNRVHAYEKKTIVKKGYIYNSEIKRIDPIYSYSVIELPHEPIQKTTPIKIRSDIIGTATLKPIHLQTLDELRVDHAVAPSYTINSIDAHINELKACLLNRRVKLGHVQQ
jgi:hypothetical protein